MFRPGRRQRMEAVLAAEAGAAASATTTTARAPSPLPPLLPELPRPPPKEALGLARLETPTDRRQTQTVKMFHDICNNPDHVYVPVCKTNRPKTDSIKNS